MKTRNRILLALLTLTTVLSAQAQTITITLKNNTIYTYTAEQYDSVRYVGGEFGTLEGVGVKIYPTGSTVSHDYLYSQVDNIVISGNPAVTISTPVISPAGGSFTSATDVTISCATPGATLYYTTDGTYPVSSSTAHTATSPVTFTLSSSATVKAIAYLNGSWSEPASANFTFQSTSTDNVNANWYSTNWTRNVGNMNYTPMSAGFYRLEVPHLSDKQTCSWVQKSTSNYGVTFAAEWDNDLVANRWTCYQMHAGNMLDKTTRKDDFKEDPDLPENTRSTLADYSGSNYSRGHLCPSADRLCSSDQNKQTFFLSNMQPQIQYHNGGQWNQLEDDIRSWAEMSDCDTLYVVKAATIENVTLNGQSQAGIFSNLCNGRLIVPKYFYMAVLAYDKAQNKYYAMGIWTYHCSSSQDKQSAEYITIDELERRTGIDFFCNLPDALEAETEATLDTTYWNKGASLSR